jgi:hypothetical protein
MATLTYGPDATTVTIEDRALAHLQYVIFQRFRRHEPFIMTIVTDEGGERRRRATWMTPDAPISFSYDTEATEALDREWLEDLMKQSYSGSGLVFSAPAYAADCEAASSIDDASIKVVAAADAIIDAAAKSVPATASHRSAAA